MFGDYAKYYNLLYQDKNYAEETDFVLGLLTNDNRALHSLLDLGCGTGRHALELARKGLAVEVNQESTPVKVIFGRSIKGGTLR